MNSNLLDNNYSPLKEMQLLANGKIHDNEIADLNGRDADNQSKLFLVAQARAELQRICKLTTFLDNIESKFMNAVNKQLIEQPDNINLIMTAMEVTTQSLKRSNDLVYNVLKDDSLQTLVVNTVNIIPGVDSSSMMDRQSRDSIRSVATNLIQQLQSPNVVDITDTDNEIEPVTIKEEDSNE